MRLCSQCKAAENPHGKLRFLDGPGGVLCEPCYSRTFGEPSPFSQQGDISGPNDKYVVIKCPDCRGSGVRGMGPHSHGCPACARYGYVRVAKNGLPIYVMKPEE